jgi:hypothetical protein
MNELVDQLADNLAVTLENIYDEVRIQEIGDWRKITAIMGDDFSLTTYGSITGIELDIQMTYHDCCTIRWQIIRNANGYEGTGLARRVIEDVIDVVDHFDDDMELTIELVDQSEGFWKHMEEEHPEISWNRKED